MSRAFFLDRDGLIIRQVEYLKCPEDVELQPGALEAFRLIREHGFKIVIVSNQSGIARKRFAMGDLQAVQRRLEELLYAGCAGFDGFYFCPHDPLVESCSCRKPAPGMIIRAAKELKLDIGESFMLGDRPGDVECGIAAGCRASAMVLTGYGAQNVNVAQERRYLVYSDFLTAVKGLLAEYR